MQISYLHASEFTFENICKSAKQVENNEKQSKTDFELGIVLKNSQINPY